MMNYISITAISRDGASAVFVKYIPLSLYRQFLYKSIPHIIMNTIMNLIVFILAKLVAPIPILYLIVVLILSTLFNIIQSFLNLIIDLKKPKLKWDTEYAVVKQNLNMIFEFILSIAIIILLIPIAFVMAEVSYIITAMLFIIVFILGIYLVRKYIDKNQVKLFEKIN